MRDVPRRAGWAFFLTMFSHAVKYAAFRRKAMYTNPKKGPIHYRSPSKMLW